jgi:SAM-dependent methyltransferase
MCSRKFAWLSSSTGDAETLRELDREMASFYADWHERAPYQSMLEDTGSAADDSSVRVLLPRYVRELSPATVLEVGCADGRQYRLLLEAGFTGAFTGVDVTVAVIERNREALPGARWETASAYALPFADEAFGLCYSLFVLEHLVYPERGLRELLRVVEPGGRLVLVFPDFVAKRQLNSQAVGFSPIARAKEKLRRGRLFDAAVSLYDTRVRLPRALREMPAKVGRFPVNAEPICLSHRDIMRPDIDAVYIASKDEVASWAQGNGHAVEYPHGTQGPFADTAFLSIVKR